MNNFENILGKLTSVSPNGLTDVWGVYTDILHFYQYLSRNQMDVETFNNWFNDIIQKKFAGITITVAILLCNTYGSDIDKEIFERLEISGYFYEIPYKEKYIYNELMALLMI